MKKQLTLDINLINVQTFANYFDCDNIIPKLKKILFKDFENNIYLYGYSGCGLTHLLNASCIEKNKYHSQSFYFSCKDILRTSPLILENLENFDLICIDDIEYVYKDDVWQVAFVDLFNRIISEKRKLLITGHKSIDDIQLNLADLESRLKFCLSLYVKNLSEDNKIEALIYKTKQAGLSISTKTAKFLVTHFKRDNHSLFKLLDKCMIKSLSLQKKISPQLINELTK